MIMYYCTYVLYALVHICTINIIHKSTYVYYHRLVGAFHPLQTASNYFPSKTEELLMVEGGEGVEPKVGIVSFLIGF